MAANTSDYILESEEEISRLSNQHGVIKGEMGRLILAPIDLSKPLRILDSATADGTWIRDLASTTAPVQHEFVGTDIDSSNFPSTPPAGQAYAVQDINKPWPEEWKESFDLVHQRLALVGGGPAQKQALANLAALVKPGGWIQLIEATNQLPEENGPAMRNFVAVMKGVFTAFGSKLDLGNQLPGWVKELGFEDVHDIVADTKLGATNPDPQLAKQGVYSTNVAATGLANFGKTLPHGSVPLSSDQIERMPSELKAELTKKGAIYPLRVVWGRKPAA